MQPLLMRSRTRVTPSLSAKVTADRSSSRLIRPARCWSHTPANSTDEALFIRPSTITRVALYSRGTTVILIMTSVRARPRPRSGSQRIQGFSCLKAASRDARPRYLADLRNCLRASLNTELFHSAAKRAGIEVQQGRRALSSFDSPVGSCQNFENVIAFHLINA